MMAAPVTALIIEDNEADAFLVKEYLDEARPDGFALEQRPDLASGLARLAEGGVDVVVLDLGLPDSQGLATFDSVHAAHPELAVVVLTGLADEPTGMRAVRAGAQDYLVKGSFNAALLIRSLGYAVEREHAERSLRDSEAHFRAFFEEASVGMATSDPDKGWLEANNAICEMLGYSRAELQHFTWADLTHPDDLQDDTEQFERVLRGEIDGYALDKRFVHKSGRVVHVHLVVHVVRHENGRPAYFAAVMDDISERKRAEAELASLTQELEVRVRERTAQLLAAEQEAEAFAYSVSHDLRAPLRAIDGFSEALEEDYRDALDDAGREDLERIRAAAQKMARLIDDLLSLSRLSRRQIDLTDVDLGVLAGEIVDTLRREEPGRRVEASIARDCVVRTDAGLAEALLANLLRNAWKFTSRRHVAHIAFAETRVDGERVFLVRDDGAGFDQARADQLFRPFERLHAASDYPGTGIGLATVRRIVLRLGGRCWAEGAEGAGAAFFFTLGTPPR